MRSLPAILLAALTALVIAASAFLTASHFGMRDWPTPPMPDTATRLITPTEAIERTRDHLSSSDVELELEVAAQAGGDSRRGVRPARRAATRRSANRSRRGSSRRGDRGGRRSGNPRSDDRRSGGRRAGGRRGADDADTPAQTDGGTGTPATAGPETTPATPAPPVSSGEQSQARPDEPVAQPPAAPAPTPAPAPVIPELLTGSDDPGAADDSDGAPGPRRGPIQNLLDQLR
jgi:hypothetical protein